MRAVCGDGFVEEGSEECDDGNSINNDDCLNTCNRAICGDDVIRVTSSNRSLVEECDDGNSLTTDRCINCKKAICGDNYTWNSEGGVEQCDDGNNINTDSCVEGCLLAKCSDGYIRAGYEDCDDGNRVDEDSCTNECKDPICGDGVTFGIGGPEDCDDGDDNVND